MKLLSVEIDNSDSCGGILNGFAVHLREPVDNEIPRFDPLCLIGPNGTGKSQFLQTLAEIFQAAWHACAPAEERQGLPAGHVFTAEYLVWRGKDETPTHVRLSRSQSEPSIKIESLYDGEWTAHSPSNADTRTLLPSRIIGYTSGENETLSLPFFASRAGYAEEVRTRVLPTRSSAQMSLEDTGDPLEPRLMLVDYGTHLELLVANLLLGTEPQKRALLEIAKLESLKSVRCVIQLASSRRTSTGVRRQSGRKGVQLTDELESYIENLKVCSTCWNYESDRESNYPPPCHEARSLNPWRDGPQ